MRPLVLALLLLSGCQPYIEAQMDLVRQARKGVELARQSQEQSHGAIEELHALRREQLNKAFDANVRTHARLDAKWVIDHRKAYSIGLDALAHERYASTAAHDAAMRNLAAMDAALQRLSWLQSIRLKWARIYRNEGMQP